MKNETRRQFNAYVDRVAELNGIDDGTKKFAVEPSAEQKLEDRIRESAGFLNLINHVGVDQQKGEKIGLDVGTPVASTTDTTAQDRQTKDPSTLTGQGYECTQTNYDTHIPYAKLDMWAKFPDFQIRLRNLITKQQARDRIMIGWRGTSRAATSDLGNNPMLEDVKKGWLQKIREDAPERHLTGVKVGDAGDADYKNIDAAVMDAGNELIEEWYQEDTDLVCILGRELLADKYLGLVENHDAPTERAALDVIVANKQAGGYKTVRVPFFPPRGFLITRLDNLSIYTQNGTRRRHLMDNAKRDRVEDFQSVNEDFVIEDFGACAFVEGILTPDGLGGWA